MNRPILLLIIAALACAPVSPCMASRGPYLSLRPPVEESPQARARARCLGDSGQCVGLRAPNWTHDPVRLRGRGVNWDCLPLRD